ncbi:hypothetical protein ES705_10582 [subsurface metagenome]
MLKMRCLLGYVVIFLAVWFSFISNGGCTKTETVYDTTTVYDTLVQYDTLDQHFLWCELFFWDWQNAMLFSDPVADPAQSEVKMEWGTQSFIFPNEVVGPGVLSFQGEQDMDSLTDYTITLTSDVGTCTGTVTLPGAVTITNPNIDDTLPFNQDVYCTWIAAQAADFYYLYYDAGGYDVMGNYIDYVQENTFTTATSHTIPASFFNIPGAVFYGVWFDVDPYTGPLPGNGFNMSGTSVGGVLLAQGNGDYVWFYVGTPTDIFKRKHDRRKVIDSEEFMKIYLETQE